MNGTCVQHLYQAAKPWFAKDNPDSKVHGANTGPIWGRQDPGGPHVGPVNFAIWEASHFIMSSTGIEISHNLKNSTMRMQYFKISWPIIIEFHFDAVILLQVTQQHFKLPTSDQLENMPKCGGKVQLLHGYKLHQLTGFSVFVKS